MATESTARKNTPPWSPARVFLLASAAYHLLLALVGLAIDQTFPRGSDAAAQAGSEHVFGIFETNGWHSLAGLIIGLVSLYFAARPEGARTAAFVIGISQAITVVALALESPSTFWLASNGADQVIHASTAIGGIGSALLTKPTRSRAPKPVA